MRESRGDKLVSPPEEGQVVLLDAAKLVSMLVPL